MWMGYSGSGCKEKESWKKTLICEKDKLQNQENIKLLYKNLYLVSKDGLKMNDLKDTNYYQPVKQLLLENK